MRKPNPGKTRFQFTALTGLDFDSCTRAAEPPAPAECHVCHGAGVYDTGAPDSTPYAPCYHCGGDGIDPQDDLAPALEASIKAVRARKRPGDEPQHVDGCGCDYDYLGEGQYREITDPRCAALRERAR